MAVAFVYAPLAPLVPLLAAFAFFASSMIYKQQLLYVAVTGHESGGRMWRVAINRMLICLVFQQGEPATSGLTQSLRIWLTFHLFSYPHTDDWPTTRLGQECYLCTPRSSHHHLQDCPIAHFRRTIRLVHAFRSRSIGGCCSSFRCEKEPPSQAFRQPRTS